MLRLKDEFRFLQVKKIIRLVLKYGGQIKQGNCFHYIDNLYEVRLTKGLLGVKLVLSYDNQLVYTSNYLSIRAVHKKYLGVVTIIVKGYRMNTVTDSKGEIIELSVAKAKTLTRGGQLHGGRGSKLFTFGTFELSLRECNNGVIETFYANGLPKDYVVHKSMIKAYRAILKGVKEC